MVSNTKLTSPVVVRLNGDGAREGKASAVSRCLFGRPDQSETSRMLADFTARFREEAAAKWNFDFQTSTPLPGRYDWQATDVRKNNDDENDEDDDGDNKDGDSAYSVPEPCKMTPLEGRLCHPEAVSAGVSAEMSKSSKSCPCSSSSSSSSSEARIISKSVLSPTEKQTKYFVRAHLKRLIGAPKKKTSGLNEAVRRELRQSLTTITEYFHSRKQGHIGARRQLKL